MKIRAHHLLCLLGFRGLGYSPEFVRRMAGTKKRLKKGPVFSVAVVDICDDICLACPYGQEKECRKGKLSVSRTGEADRKVLKVLGLRKGETVPSDKIFPLLREKINSFSKIIPICGKCGWREVCTYYLELRDSWRTKRKM